MRSEQELRAKHVIAGLVVLVIGLAYVAGYWPEHRRRVALEADAAALRERLADSEACVHMAESGGDGGRNARGDAASQSRFTGLLWQPALRDGARSATDTCRT